MIRIMGFRCDGLSLMCAESRAAHEWTVVENCAATAAGDGPETLTSHEL